MKISHKIAKLSKQSCKTAVSIKQKCYTQKILKVTILDTYLLVTDVLFTVHFVSFQQYPLKTRGELSPIFLVDGDTVMGCFYKSLTGWT